MTAWLTPADVAQSLGFTAKTIRVWCRRGIFEGATKFPDDSPTSEWRIPASAVEAFKRERAQRAVSVPHDRLEELMDAALGVSR